MTLFPDDEDGAVLEALAAQGLDMTLPAEIEFFVSVPNESAANQTARAMSAAGYETEVEYDEGEPGFDANVDDAEEFGPSWTVCAIVQMVPDYNEIVRIQVDLDRLSLPFDGKSDGWGVMLSGDTD